ncbi:MAG: hypothetical protein K0U74_14820 [Alphaproteobacteria bacterium]|nr:hypothetical protein [Alphaproteobacteria bacterium]
MQVQKGHTMGRAYLRLAAGVLLAAMLVIGNGGVVSISSAAEKVAGGKLPEGTKTIYLVDAAGKEYPIGDVDFSSKEGASRISVQINEKKFVEKFLSMRPFRCIDGKKQTVCYLPYPYKLKDKITNQDLVDLEYRLLFLHKGPTDYGIDAWNGLYYKLSITEDATLKGALHEADFNVLAVPPDVEFSRPIGPVDLTEAEEGRHRFPGLVIR